MITYDRLAPSARAMLQGEFDQLRNRIAANIVSEGANASGKTIRSLKVEVREKGGGWQATLWGRAFFGTLETGSSAWKNQYKHPPLWFRDIIAQWIKDKGLNLSAYCVARKIMREGTKLHRAGGRDTIYSREIPRTLQNISEKMLAFWAEASVSTIQLNKAGKAMDNK